jgi:tRNA U55 pseudouridine synthase TruB
MAKLRRIKAGLFSSSDKEFSTIEKFDLAVKEHKEGKEEKLRKMIVPAEIIIDLLPTIEVEKKWLGKLKHGSPIFDEMLIDLKADKKIIDEKEPFAILCEGKLIEIAKYSDKFEQKSILAKPEVMLIERD